ncbi:hypothetical protein EXIGLDRAFT_774029 [Exidia glandulosa HHB12029]|uniref:Uncharacterized protein n=1 Tax=Exidia glandulosa HHB12029 TaxID=1314781 RepID=A0A165EJ22_EXIGL|nr:hypothetical protein EXIGLDRAFT_774029 [Exidia glandulosa HHB12029]
MSIPAPPPAPNPAASLCCSSVLPHRSIRTHWELLFTAFLAWLTHNGKNTTPAATAPGCEIIIRLTTTINYGRSCGVMEYAAFRAPEGQPSLYTFVRVTAGHGQRTGFTDQCAFKNWSCQLHGLYYRLDLYRPQG